MLLFIHSTYRIVTTPGIEETLVKELVSLGITNAHKVQDRKIVEANGSLADLYKIIYYSRISENIKIKMGNQIIARGDKELKKNAFKLPWHAYLPLDNFLSYTFPYVIAKSFQSNLYHERKISEIIQGLISKLKLL